MDSVALNNAISVPYTNTLAGSAASQTVPGGQTFADLLTAQLSDTTQVTLAESAGVAASSLSDASALAGYNIVYDSDVTADGTAAADITATDATASGTNSVSTSNESDSSNNTLMTLLMMMCSGSSGESNGTNAAMMSLLSSLQDSGISSLLSAGDISSLTSILSGQTSATGKTIVDQAMTRLGDPYSKSKRGTGNYVDCSYFAQWAYKQAGIDIPGTAAAQAKYCYENGYTISKDELKPGDLIFWTKHSSDSGRWREIHHVAIYAGDGKIVEAKNPKNGVEVDDIWGKSGNGGDWEIVMYARPY